MFLFKLNAWGIPKKKNPQNSLKLFEDHGFSDKYRIPTEETKIFFLLKKIIRIIFTVYESSLLIIELKGSVCYQMLKKIFKFKFQDNEYLFTNKT